MTTMALAVIIRRDYAPHSEFCIVNTCQSFAISRQCDLNGMLWA